MFKTSSSPNKIADLNPTTRYPNLNNPIPQNSPATPAAPAAQPKPVAVEKTASNEGSIGNRLIVGPDVKLKGAEINDCDTLIVEGRVEATLDSRIIRVAEEGSFNGTVGVETAEIHGRFDGELTVRGQLFIHATGRVSGKIRYGKILIEEGGQISGDVQAIAANEPGLFNTAKAKPLTALN
jgi:cytoskeletal protein CcmA (bactofilin family)